MRMNSNFLVWLTFRGKCLAGIAACRLCIFVAVTAVKIIFFML